MVFICYWVFYIVRYALHTVHKKYIMIKMSSDVKRNDNIISEINKDFLKKTIKERISKKAIDLLRRDFVNLREEFRMMIILDYKADIMG